METTIFILILFAAMFLAYANGANDNFKGVATLYGSKTANYKKALVWTTITTGLGCLLALYFAGELVIVFKGKGLVPESIIQMQSFPLAVGVAAATTVLFATILKLPVSTTHALIGALAGAGWVASAAGINWAKLADKFFLPLIAGPIISLVLAYIIYPQLKALRKTLKIGQQTCLCVGKDVMATIPTHAASKAEFMDNYSSLDLPVMSVTDTSYCRSTYSGDIIGISANSLLDVLHYLSSGLVCFARGLNDTPKIAALLLIGSRFDLKLSIVLVGVFMLVGGLIHSKGIARTMGEKVTQMNPGQAFTANLITGIMVCCASKIGVPVSTTHVSCGSIFGIGAVNKKINLKVLFQILLAWVTTLPMGFVLGTLFMKML
ncbi:MAG: anion permease [Bacteriovoracaceae bacterium]|nr:anion permease [Bacteriovoracaceae bacterium]